MAGFQVTLRGRIWVTAEVKTDKVSLGQDTPRGGLLKAVESACRAIPGVFQAKQVIEHMLSSGYVFHAKDKFIAVNSALKRLIKQKKLAMVERGVGKRPSKYEFIRRFPRLEKEGTAA